jgi:DDE_Tnp_1-associated
MEPNGVNAEALAETTFFLYFFKDMPDRRQAGKVVYPLDEILLLCLLAVLAGAEAFTDIARFGEKKIELSCRERRARSSPTRDPRRW